MAGQRDGASLDELLFVTIMLGWAAVRKVTTCWWSTIGWFATARRSITGW